MPRRGRAMRVGTGRKRGWSGWARLGTAVLALAVAFFSVLATAALLERPGARERIAALWQLGPSIRPLADPVASGDVLLARVMAERDALRTRLASLETDATATGSLGGRAGTPAVSAAGAAPQSPAASVAMHTLFGADLGAGTNVADLRRRWRSVRQLLADEEASLQPIMAVREVDFGFKLHLVVGPMSDAANVAAFCARMSAAVPSCTTVPFDGQRLALP
jgi:hypothetical protein